MFIHSVLFEIKPGQVSQYRKDSKMWARYARQARGFVAYFTMKRLGFKNQYASIYQWETKQDHDRFMKKFHDWLVSKSKAGVKVLGYYNLKGIDRIRNTT
jgi:heme-degrading monooxygenase HmoA